jgi:hypothetical protein
MILQRHCLSETSLVNSAAFSFYTAKMLTWAGTGRYDSTYHLLTKSGNLKWGHAIGEAEDVLQKCRSSCPCNTGNRRKSPAASQQTSPAVRA